MIRLAALLLTAGVVISAVPAAAQAATPCSKSDGGHDVVKADDPSGTFSDGRCPGYVAVRQGRDGGYEVGACDNGAGRDTYYRVAPAYPAGSGASSAGCPDTPPRIGAGGGSPPAPEPIEPVAGLPEGAPAAALRREPALPRPAGWPFAEAFPRTSGTGRLHGGAAYWADYLYDDHGARASGATSSTYLTNPQGSYTYPPGPAANNGADIFRTAVGADEQATYWRVDFTTLADPAVPIVEWAIDADGDPRTGKAAWTAGAGLTSAGIEATLLVSATKAVLTDLASGAVTDVSAGLSVDRRSRSFVVRVPRAALALGDRSTVRVATGLADAAGTGFAAPSGGRDAGQAPVFNVGYRAIADEPVSYAGAPNPWNEAHQAADIAAGDVSEFATAIDWKALLERASTPEPAPRGASDRWYLSPLDLGQGVRTGAGYGDIDPVYLSQPQPYAVYVPPTWDGKRSLPLTFLLHSSTQNHNQYLSNPNILQNFCTDRSSLCVTTLDRGPIGWYMDTGEVDLFNVWRQVALAYPLDPEATTIGGYSMGGWAAWRQGLQHPDLFAAGFSLEGPVNCGGGTNGPINSYGQTGHCQADGDTAPLLENARWLPFVVNQSTQDEFVPYETVARQVRGLDDLGYRYRFETTIGGEHLTATALDTYKTTAAALGGLRRTPDPGRISYRFYSDAAHPDWGVGPDDVYWLRDLRARTVAPGTTAEVQADDAALPEGHTVTRSQAPTTDSGVPAAVQELTWRPAAAPAPRQELTLTLTNIAEISIDVDRARLRHGTATVTIDGPTTLRLVASGGVMRTLTLAAGTQTVSW